MVASAEQIARVGSSPQRLVRRAKIVLAAAAGAANAAIALNLPAAPH